MDYPNTKRASIRWNQKAMYAFFVSVTLTHPFHSFPWNVHSLLHHIVNRLFRGTPQIGSQKWSTWYYTNDTTKWYYTKNCFSFKSVTHWQKQSDIGLLDFVKFPYHQNENKTLSFVLNPGNTLRSCPRLQLHKCQK